MKLTDAQEIWFWERYSLNKKTLCWEWTGHKTKKGHGAVRIAGEHWYAHRLAFLLRNGEIPEGLWVLHRCNNAACINPDHLYLGTHAENMRDMRESGRRKNVTRGEKSGRARLTEDQVRWLRSMRGAVPQKDLAAQLGVSVGCVAHVMNGRNWSHI